MLQPSPLWRLQLFQMLAQVTNSMLTTTKSISKSEPLAARTKTHSSVGDESSPDTHVCNGSEASKQASNLSSVLCVPDMMLSAVVPFWSTAVHFYATTNQVTKVWDSTSSMYSAHMT